MVANSTDADTGRRLMALEDALYNLQRERRATPSTLDNCPTGMVAGFQTSTPPQGWLPLDGSVTVTASNYPSLYAYLNANGLSLTLADWRGKMPIGAGGTYSGTSTGGSADAAVVSHSHPIGVTRFSTTAAHTHSNQGGTVAEGPDPNNGAASPVPVTGSTGSSGTGANLPPYRGLYWMIRT